MWWVGVAVIAAFRWALIWIFFLLWHRQIFTSLSSTTDFSTWPRPAWREQKKRVILLRFGVASLCLPHSSVCVWVCVCHMMTLRIGNDRKLCEFLPQVLFVWIFLSRKLCNFYHKKKEEKSRIIRLKFWTKGKSVKKGQQSIKGVTRARFGRSSYGLRLNDIMWVSGLPININK